MDSDADSSVHVEEIPRLWPPGLTAPHPPPRMMPDYGGSYNNNRVFNSHRGHHSPQRVHMGAVNNVPVYTGKEGQDAHSWIQAFEQSADLYEWDEVQCLKIAKTRLDGIAGITCTFENWTDFKRQFQTRFGEKEEALLARLMRCTQMADESVKAFGDRFRLLAHRAGRKEDTLLNFQFLKALHSNLQKQIIPHHMKTMNEIIEYAIYLEEWMNDGIYDHDNRGLINLGNSNNCNHNDNNNGNGYGGGAGNWNRGTGNWRNDNSGGYRSRRDQPWNQKRGASRYETSL
eukprot:jgi/Chrzof1/2034/UNPLg00690.t1